MSTPASNSNTDDNTQTTTDGTSQGNVPERQDSKASTGSSYCASERGQEEIWDEAEFTFEPGNISHAPTWGTDYNEVRDDPGPDNWAALQQQQQDAQQQQQGGENSAQGGNN
ncbi:uncharacterized protein L199_007205 [Kwoniella botswanensis]|uniref:uncharacterized protein n=1 Tax=Kwoniella botswanensis TaxID=1268659 RepID=UPI00315C64A4